MNDDATGQAEFANRVLESMTDVFWDPEVERRGGIEATGPIVKALAILTPGRPVEVRLNDEVDLVARARSGSAVKRGEAVTMENLEAIEGLEPLDVDINAGWVLLVVLPDGQHFAQFDFIQNRGRSLQILKLASDYLATARTASNAELFGPALENLLAAAELAITAQTSSFAAMPGERKRRNVHSARLHWSKVNVGLGNTTPTAHATLVTLHSLRAAARYGEGELPEQGQVEALIQPVTDLVEDSARRIGQPLRTQDPAFTIDVDLRPSK
ncbi:hypothetical protein [Luteipulveratus mongoliensis]|uniref:Uncharacterized protein n=1 Tax=Luteipulveratus mongoliensis TaxID=571913 RepID=A0A0K1JNC3_9MICO|nr:hypothetical protein [Luteipulveratus mongoliensis]AKU18207.1 hypothetical protein VV02_24075 [Luteipulveratus mongoliensis]